MFGIALEISLDDFKAIVKSPKSVLIGAISQFVLLPLITFLLVLWLEPLPSIAMGMFMVAACPGGNVSNFMTHLAKGNTALSISLTALATLLAIVLTPINLQILGNLYEPTRSILKAVTLSPWQMIKLVSLLLGLPLVLGVALNHYRKCLGATLGQNPQNCIPYYFCCSDCSGTLQ